MYKSKLSCTCNYNQHLTLHTSNQKRLGLCVIYSYKGGSSVMESATRNSLQWSSSSKVAILLYYALVFSMLQLQMPATADAALSCSDIVGEYRDCTCGIKYRDVETRCQDEHTYYQPVFSQQNLSCNFTCLNGGSYDSLNRRCSCSTPQNPIATSHGLCCEVRKF